MIFKRERTATVSWDCSVNEVFAEMSEGERMHMVNKLNKEGYEGQKSAAAREHSERTFDILDDACDFWKAEAIERGYVE
jgi:hypothetical protein